MYKTILPVIFGLFQVLKANKPPKLCVTATKNCRDDVFMCGIAYGRFMSACDLVPKPMSTRSNENLTSYVAPPTRKPCSRACVEAIEVLKRTKRGKELHECDCQLDGECLIVKARVAKCFNRTNRRAIGCTLALWNCTRDPTCRFLQSQFLGDCREMVNGVRCEKKCQRIQKRLFQATYGKRLADCECDGPTEAYCRAIRGHAKQLRCQPGMDGSGTPVFTYVATDSEIIHGVDVGDVEQNSEKNNTANFQTPSWTLVVLVLILFLL